MFYRIYNKCIASSSGVLNNKVCLLSYLEKCFHRPCFVRCASGAPMFKPKIAKVRKQKTSTMLALDHFDFYYGPMFGKRWPSIRLGLLTKNKFVAILNRFSQSYEVKKPILLFKLINFSSKCLFL